MTEDVAEAAGPALASPAKPTLKTIALLTGLAVPTVSRALGDAPDISPGTKALVRRVAAEVGYVPNRAGVRLRTGRTNVLALVMSTEHDMMNHTAKLITSLAGALRGTPYHLNVSPVFPDEDPLPPIRHIVESGLADAVIFNQTQPRDPRVAWLMERGFPFATHGRTVWADRHPWADFDNAAFGAIAVRRLARRGRGRIVLMAPPGAQNYAVDMVAGTLGEAARLGLGARVLPGIDSDRESGAMQAAVARALASGADGIVCGSPAGAMAAVAAIEGRGMRLGEGVDIASKEAIAFLRLFRAGIIAVREDVGRAGEVLARAAIRAIREPGSPPIQEIEVPADDAADDAADDLDPEEPTA